MKKGLMILLAMVLSFSVFAFDGYNNRGFEGNKKGMHHKGFGNRPGKGGYLIGKIKIADLKQVGVSQANIDIIVAKVNEFKDYHKRNKLDIEEKQLKIKRLMLEKEKNWFKIEGYLKEIALLKADSKLKILKGKDELKQYITDAQYEEALQLAKQRRGKFRNKNKMKNKKGKWNK